MNLKAILLECPTNVADLFGKSLPKFSTCIVIRFYSDVAEFIVHRELCHEENTNITKHVYTSIQCNLETQLKQSLNKPVARSLHVKTCTFSHAIHSKITTIVSSKLPSIFSCYLYRAFCLFVHSSFVKKRRFFFQYFAWEP